MSSVYPLLLWPLASTVETLYRISNGSIWYASVPLITFRSSGTPTVVDILPWYVRTPLACSAALATTVCAALSWAPLLVGLPEPDAASWPAPSQAVRNSAITSPVAAPATYRPAFGAIVDTPAVTSRLPVEIGDLQTCRATGRFTDSEGLIALAVQAKAGGALGPSRRMQTQDTGRSRGRFGRR